MKRTIAFIFAAAALLCFSSCQKDAHPTDGEEIEATFTITVPEGIQTRSYSDGTKATQLYYAVYDGNKYLKGNDEALVMENLKKTVTIKLVKNYTYNIVFWAQAADAPYALDMQNATMTVKDYAGPANNDKRDAFYRCISYTYSSQPTDVDLYRPFAQINFASSDYDDVVSLLGHTMTSTMVIKGLPDVLNLLDGTLGTSTKDTQFTASAVPATPIAPATVGEKISINGDSDTYGYVAMNYVLAPNSENELKDVTGIFNYNGKSLEIEVANVPYRRNWKTNIYGAMFTENAELTVKIVKDFTDDYDKTY